MRHFFFSLMLTLVSVLAWGQATIDINTTQPTGTMKSYLNGVGRNHFKAYIDQFPNNPADGTWKENRLDEKLDLYRDLLDNFATGTNKILYRLGHNISDGNVGVPGIYNDANTGFYPNGDYASHPGWHWASTYESGGDFGSPLNGPSPSVRLGAGLHRYFFKANGRYSGFVVNIYYPQLHLNITDFNCPVSYSLTATTATSRNLSGADIQRPSNPNQSIYIVEQIGGPRIGDNVQLGNYEVSFRMKHKDFPD
jgi:hypothetical protein